MHLCGTPRRSPSVQVNDYVNRGRAVLRVVLRGMVAGRLLARRWGRVPTCLRSECGGYGDLIVASVLGGSASRSPSLPVIPGSPSCEPAFTQVVPTVRHQARCRGGNGWRVELLAVPRPTMRRPEPPRRRQGPRAPLAARAESLPWARSGPSRCQQARACRPRSMRQWNQPIGRLPGDGG